MTTHEDILAILSTMSLEEKVAQLCQIDMAGFVAEAAASTGTDTQTRADDRCVGSVISGGGADAEDFARVQRALQGRSPHGIPALFMSDVIHGFRTIFPIPLGLACAFDPQQAEKMGRVSAEEATASGLHVTFAPMADVVRDPRWGRCMESAGESPRLCADMAAATVRGFTGKGLGSDSGMACCVKHFAGYGLAEAGRDYAPVDVSRTELYNTYFPPFRAALDAGCRLLMPAFTPVERLPAVMNPWLLNTVLRKQWGFTGMVISDWDAPGELRAHGLAKDAREAAKLSLMAGNDMDMMSGAYAEALTGLVQDGTVPIARLDEAVLRVLEIKRELGLFDKPCKNDSREKQQAACYAPAHRAAAREAALKSCVLLQNGGALPIRAGRRVALAGDHADTRALLGAWRCSGRMEETPTLREAFVGVPVCAPEDADVIVYAVGEEQDDTGEAASKADPALTKAQMDELRRLHALGKPVVVVLFCGRPLILTEVLPLCDALLVAWFPGSEGAKAIRRLLLGEQSPSGHLSMTFPRSVGQIPIHHDALTVARPDRGAPNNRYVSRYLDEQTAPLFPFGFGLSYTRFLMDDVKVSPVMTQSAPAEVSCTVRNVGERDGETVVQLYAQCVHSGRMHPLRQLVAYQRVRLAVGEEKRLTLRVCRDDLLSWDGEGNAEVFTGQWRVYLGESSDAPDVGSFEYRS